MGLKNVEKVLSRTLEKLKSEGRLKGKEYIVTNVKRGKGEKGPRYFLQGKGEQEFLKMNSNSYLGMSLREEIIQEEEKATIKYGVGPGAVRFISGTFHLTENLKKN